MHITCRPEKEVVDGWLNELDGSKVLKVRADVSGITHICWPGLQSKRQGDTVSVHPYTAQPYFSGRLYSRGLECKLLTKAAFGWCI